MTAAEGITFDFNGMFAHAIGSEHGIGPAEIQRLELRLTAAQEAVRKAKLQGTLGFMELPYRAESCKKIASLGNSIAKKFENFVVLGIGGSALGAIALHSALNRPFYNLLSRQARKGRSRLFVEDNVDPCHIAGMMEVLDLRKTCFNVITKSGDTVETMASFFLVRDLLRKRLGAKKAASHLIATTSRGRGTLFDIAHGEGYPILDIPDNVGGRFSVLSAVGLLPAAVTGIRIADLCAGAETMDEACAGGEVQKNPALMAAALHYLAYQKGKRISVLMPYAQGLKDVADWYAQLWAESLGKQKDRAGKNIYAGPTPVKALGVTDQHSQLQLYQEGPFDKIVTFLTVEKFPRDIRIPKAFPDRDIHHLWGHSFQELMHVEQEATALSLSRAQRMNATIRLSRLNAKTLGMLLYFFQMQMAYAGELFDVNAFDQPGVEQGKQFAYGILGRKGYEAKREEFLQGLETREEYRLRVLA